MDHTWSCAYTINRTFWQGWSNCGWRYCMVVSELTTLYNSDTKIKLRYQKGVGCTFFRAFSKLSRGTANFWVKNGFFLSDQLMPIFPFEWKGFISAVADLWGILFPMPKLNDQNRWTLVVHGCRTIILHTLGECCDQWYVPQHLFCVRSNLEWPCDAMNGSKHHSSCPSS